jgi:hypothetical protein
MGTSCASQVLEGVDFLEGRGHRKLAGVTSVHTTHKRVNDFLVNLLYVCVCVMFRLCVMVYHLILGCVCWHTYNTRT